MNEKAVKTMDELREQWGMERYVSALGDMMGFILGYSGAIPVGARKELMSTNADVWEVLLSYMLYGLDGDGLSVDKLGVAPELTENAAG